MQKIKVFIIDDDEYWIKTTIQFLEYSDDIQVVGYCTDTTAAIKAITARPADIILLDNHMHGNPCAGLQLLPALNKASNTKIIMLTSLYDKDLIVDTISNGAVNYVLKNDFSTLPTNIKNVINGNSPFEVMSKEFRDIHTKNQLSVLSESELVIFTLLEEGLGREEICERLYKSSSTIKNQISSILKKLEVNTTKEALEKFRRNK